MRNKILITGGAGFVGSNLAIFLKNKLKDSEVICFDNLIRNGSELNVERLKDSQVAFVKGDIRNKEDLDMIADITHIIECSAEPSILAGYEDPRYMIDTNLVGTANCLEIARRKNAAFIFMSTSRVYPIEKLESLKSEELENRYDWSEELSELGVSYQGVSTDFPLKGYRSLYGATKLSSELLITEYFNMFKIKGVINRLGMIAGPWQMSRLDQGLVGLWVSAHHYNRELGYIGYNGEGKQLRDVVHIDDVCELVFKQISEMDNVNHQTFNAGGGRQNSASLKELTQVVSEVTQKSIPISSIQEERKSDVRIYITDNSHVSSALKWSPQKNIKDIIIDTHQWISQNSDKLKPILNS